MTERERRLRLFAALAAGALAVGVVPEATLFKCPVKSLTGYYCPGCGVQRAYRFAVRGRLKDAVSANALVFTLPAFLVALRLTEGPEVSQLRRSVIATAGIATLAFAVLRNRPTSRLAPS
jgi:Protein of unknown function (DUF2752)